MPLDVMENSFESQPRNPVIAKLFRLAHISENLGYGLRKLKRWQEVTGCPMHIETTINYVKVTFDLQTRDIVKIDDAKNVDEVENGAKNGAKKTSRQDAILALIEHNPEITLDAIAKEIGIGTTTLDREIAKMSHLIQRKSTPFYIAKGFIYEIYM